MDAVIAGCVSLVPGGISGLIGDIDAGRSREILRLDDPSRPGDIAAGSWRRMSRLSRLVAAVATPFVADRADRDGLVVVWGTALGELVPTGQVLERMASEGPAAVSPLAFQNSVYNAPIGHLSIAMALRGPCETVSAGGASGLMALLRGLLWLERGAPVVLVVAGDVTAPLWERAWALQGPPTPRLGEAVSAVLLARGGPGPRISLHLGVRPGARTLTRRTALPGEGLLDDIPGALAIEGAIGLCPSSGLAALVALAQCGGGVVVDRDGPRAVSAAVAL